MSRVYRSVDVEAWHGLWNRAWDDGDPSPDWLDRISQQRGFVAFAIDRGEPLTLAALRLAYDWPEPNVKGRCHYTQLTMVDPAHRRQGLATTLLEAHVAWARGRYDAIVTQNAMARRAICAFNTAHGFIVERRETSAGREQRWLRLAL